MYETKYKFNNEDKNLNNKLSNTLSNFYKKNYSPNPIKEPKAGIPQNYIFKIEDSLFSDLQCSICSNLLWNPMECNDCGNSFL